MKKECKIVQDLLPSYVDKLTNEETNNTRRTFKRM